VVGRRHNAGRGHAAKGLYKRAEKGRSAGGHTGTGGGIKVEDCYYPYAMWIQLAAKQQRKAREFVQITEK
jgi:hypothetical protein